MLNRQMKFLVLTVMGVAAMIALTTPTLFSKIRFGLEFRGGYEIYYVVESLNGSEKPSSKDLIATADILRQRADSIGMAEPEIHIEGDNHIRLKLAGLTSADESRSGLARQEGLPTKLTEKYTQTVGSILGSTALKDTMLAGIIGIGCIFVLLIALYRGVGLLAALSTVVYLWLLLILFVLCHATLSLSAVVAFVLGIGMAADASIICFERIKEELERGSNRRHAVEIGFKESFSTIRDANLVTALAMIALFVAGIGPIQGFSLTMLASIIVSVGTNFFFVRMLSNWLATSETVSLSLFIGKPRRFFSHSLDRFNFIQFGKVAVVMSAITIASGLFYYRAHGLNLDIDFTAGTALDIDLETAITQEAATQIMTEAGTAPATVAIGGKGNEHIAARFDEVLKPEALSKIISAFKNKYQDKVVYEENTADPGVAQQFARKAVYALIAAFVSIGLFIGFRFSWAMAFATLIPIVHDLLLVSAIFALFKLEIDVTYIAALLTVIGYSLNDKIVIFGRVRENLRNAKSDDDLERLVNNSVRQTLGRSIYTVLTVVVASVCLYFFACEPLQMFALALVIGLISGAYSSVFMSTLLWVTVRSPDKRSSSPSTSYAVAKSALLAVGLFTLGAAFGWYLHPESSSKNLSKTSSTSIPSASAVGPLGDLTPFLAIAKDSLKLVEGSDLKGAKIRIKDLESAWDASEERLYPMNMENWTSVDKSIDRALSQLRSGAPDASECLKALKSLISKMETMQSKN